MIQVMQSTNLDMFVKAVYGINPRYTDIFGNGLPGMAGSAIAIQGANTSATDVVRRLKNDTAALIKAFNQKSANDIFAYSSRIEGHLLLLQTLGVITNQLCKTLLEDLDRLSHEYKLKP